MKSKIGLLLKTIFKNTYKIRTMSLKKKILMSLLVIYIVCAVEFSVFSLSTVLFNKLNEFSLTSYFVVLLFAIAVIFSFLFTIFNAKSVLFDSKDNDLLLSLPLKKSTILLSRFAYLALFNMLIGVCILIPGLFIYISNVGISFSQCIILLVMIILLPIIPTILSSLLGYLIAFITSKTNKKNVVELICYSVFILSYFALSFSSNSLLLKLFNNTELMNTILKIVFCPLYLANEAFLTESILYIFYYVAINVGLISLFGFCLKRSYFTILSKLSSHKTKSDYKMKKYNSRSVKRTLRELEIKKYFGCAIYVFNTIFGVVILLIASIASLFYDSQTLLQIVGEDLTITSSLLVLVILLFVTSLTDTTNSSISIERNNFWIMKMLPISNKDIIDSKIFVNRIIFIPFVTLSLLLFKISGYINYTELLLLFILAYIYNYAIANFGIICNLLFPKLDAPNDTYVVKQSLSSMLGIMVPFVFGILAITLIVTLKMSNITFIIALIGISIVLFIITRIIILKWGYKRLSQIN